jgi:GT2 family glycosyltransferase
VDLSVVIPNWNGGQALLECVGAVCADLERSGLSYEVIVVDDASTDGSAQAAGAQCPEMRIVLNPRNCGFAFTVNTGIRRSSGDYVLLLNNDATPEPGAMRRVWTYLRDHPAAGAAGCRIVGREGGLERSCRDFPSLGNLVLRRVLGGGTDAWPHDSNRYVDWIHMVFLMISRDALRAVGNLDERFFMYGEDTDFGWRLKRAGLGLVFLPDVSVVHIKGHSGNQRWGRQAVVMRQAGLHQVLRKYYSSHYVLLYRALMIALQAFRLARLRARAFVRSQGDERDVEREIARLVLQANLRRR